MWAEMQLWGHFLLLFASLGEARHNLNGEPQRAG